MTNHPEFEPSYVVYIINTLTQIRLHLANGILDSTGNILIGDLRMAYTMFQGIILQSECSSVIFMGLWDAMLRIIKLL